MAFGRLERTAAQPPMSDINMTPLIDVMLVLLVIFMVTAPLMGSALQLDLPKADAPPADAAPAALSVAIDAQGQLHLGDEPLADDALAERLKRAGRERPEAEVQLRADRRVPYGRVAEVLGWLQDAGLTRIGFVTAPPDAPAALPAGAAPPARPASR